jgi:hypothetical protein
VSSSSTSCDSPHSQVQFSCVLPIYRCKATTSSNNERCFPHACSAMEGFINYNVFLILADFMLLSYMKPLRTSNRT